MNLPGRQCLKSDKFATWVIAAAIRDDEDFTCRQRLILFRNGTFLVMYSYRIANARPALGSNFVTSGSVTTTCCGEQTGKPAVAAIRRWFVLVSGAMLTGQPAGKLAPVTDS
ncbi:hypothetical protein [Mesorhizobium sp. KR2-14]|uniref:hypothetical protein n=1 Tax=Mesorhizobium sp. KR2-14 TaxID=3156610 RepID=UPI0032B3334A